uniref:Uncharacterized protein n=1 Tax=Erpetoichthys calabaricus TaxID=27687 RepID=A0A8C4X383_ERPCA
MSLPCVILGMNEVIWQETRMMHANGSQDTSDVSMAGVPTGMTNIPGMQPALSGRSQDDANVGYFFQRQAGEQLGDTIHVDQVSQSSIP